MNAGYKITSISAGQQSLINYLQKTWSSRSMTITLAKRELNIKYAQTILGLSWAIFQPLAGLLIFTIFFDKLIGLKTDGIPYPLFAFSGMVSWFFFSHIIHGAGMALQEGQALIKKIYFPRLILLISKVMVASVEFLISMALLFLMLIIMGKFPGWPILLLPVFVAFNIAAGLSIAIWLSALTIRYRDFYHIIPYLVGFGIWLTPVFYPDTLIPSQYSWFLYLNPMAATCAGFRWCLSGGNLPDPGYLLSLIPVLFLLISGLDYFRKIEDNISDYI